MAALPLGAIVPAGWLKNQMQLQAGAITGILEEIWPDVGPDSGWLGGKGESWERGPYYLDGLVPLAYLLNDKRLIAKVVKWMEWTLSNQTADGTFGPPGLTDEWPRILMLKPLMQYHEVTGDHRVLGLMGAYFEYLRNKLMRHGMAASDDNKWAYYRGDEAIIAALWLYKRTGEKEVLVAAHSIMVKSFDWAENFKKMPYREKSVKWEHESHVVNNAMAIKYPVLRWFLTGEPALKKVSKTAIMALMKYHGHPEGIFSGDECLAGTDPSQGTETCAVVEYMFSLENLAIALGDPFYGDVLERVAFNALPGALTPDLLGHCYDQQPNQVLISKAKRNWTTNGEDANLLGLEPNYGCCTANLHQGWPKFTAHLWASTPDGGIAAVAYAPCEVSAVVGHAAHLRMKVETEYPFRDKIRISMKLEEPARFPVRLRIPFWCTDPGVAVNGEKLSGAKAGHYFEIKRDWMDGDVVELDLPMGIRVTHWFNSSSVIERGPLVYSLPVGESWQKTGGPEQCPTFEVHPTTDWNYALVLPAGKPDTAFTVREEKVVLQPFDADAPVRLVAKGRKVPGWELRDNSAAPPPVVFSHSGELKEIELIPYGCAKLRITEFPITAE
jgi:hypothetical protein